MAAPEISLIRGLPCEIIWTFPNDVTLTGTAVYMTAKKESDTKLKNDSDDCAIFKKRQTTHNSAHVTTISIETEDTDYQAGRSYVYDILVVEIATGKRLYGTKLGPLHIAPRGTAEIDEES